MSSRFNASIPENDWYDISKAPKDGRIVFVRDNDGKVDLAKWSCGEWTAEFGLCDGITWFAYVSISGA